MKLVRKSKEKEGGVPDNPHSLSEKEADLRLLDSAKNKKKRKEKWKRKPPQITNYFTPLTAVAVPSGLSFSPAPCLVPPLEQKTISPHGISSYWV